METKRLLLAAARGCRIQFRFNGNHPTEWGQSYGLATRIDFIPRGHEYRVHPEDVDKMWGPISGQFYRWAQNPSVVCLESLEQVSQVVHIEHWLWAWRAYPEKTTELELSLWLLFMAEIVMDDGL